MDFLLAIFWFLVATGILVVSHEWGHFFVARKLGVHVLRFSVGFGSKPIKEWRGKDGVEYWLSPIPLGGYVKFVGNDDPAIALGAKPFLSEPIWKRMLIVIAGPLVNLLLAVLFFAGAFMVGIADFKPVLGQTEKQAQLAGLREGDEISSVQGTRTENWSDALIAIIEASYGREAIELEISRGNETRAVSLALPKDRSDETEMLRSLGLTPYVRDPLAQVAIVVPNGPAERAGIKVGDRIMAINGIAAERDQVFRKLLQEQAQLKQGQVTLTVLRASGIREDVSLKSELDRTRNPPAWVLRVGFEIHATQRKMPVLEALQAGFGECLRYAKSSLHIMYRMVTGEASTKNLSGPVTIAQVTRDAAADGLSYFLRILALVSLSLFLLNMLPIPMLDGGQLLYYTIEAIKGRPMSESLQLAGQYLGVVLILSLAVLALFNDIVRLLPSS
jgi:regulator of sigma E protease